MNKIFCGNCGTPERVKRPLRNGDKCPRCNGKMGIHIKGSRELYSDKPNSPVRISRRCRPVMKDGSVCNKSAVRGASPSSGAML